MQDLNQCLEPTQASERFSKELVIHSEEECCERLTAMAVIS